MFEMSTAHPFEVLSSGLTIEGCDLGRNMA